MKKLLLLGGARYLIPYIEAAHRMGVYVITCDYLPDNAAHRYSDEYADVSIIDRDAVLAKAEQLDIDGIMSPATDPGVVTASYVAEKMGLPGSPYKSVDILQHKDRFRKFLKDNGFVVPEARGYDNRNQAIAEAVDFAVPFIVKPTDSAGSKGVTRIDDIQQLPHAIDQAFDASLSGHIIIEDFIEKTGSSSDTDAFSIDSDLAFCSFNCQHFDSRAANPYTPAAYSWPSDMPGKIQENLRSELQRLIRLLDLGTSQYNIETRMGTDGRGYIMEVSPRAGGNRLSEILKYACGQDLISNAVRAALGMPLDSLHDPVYNHGVWAEYILHSNIAGRYAGMEIEPEFEKNHVIEKDLWLEPGDRVYEFTGANRAIGTLVLHFDTREEAEECLENIDRFVKVRLN